jgi:hypothetical protein
MSRVMTCARGLAKLLAGDDWHSTDLPRSFECVAILLRYWFLFWTLTLVNFRRITRQRLDREIDVNKIFH